MSIPDDFFDIKGNFVPMKLVELITDDEIDNRLLTPITERGGDTIWHYKNELGIYKPNGIAYVRNETKRALKQRSKKSHVNEVVFLALIETYIKPEEFVEDPNLIVVKNGVFHIDTRELTEHNHMDYAKAALPVTYDPEAKCPLFLKFLERVAPTYIEFLQEWTGYHLLKDQRYQRFVILLGDRDNGKSTYLHVLNHLLGPENVSHQNLYRLTTNRFAIAELYGKFANIAADIGPDEIRYTGALKVATGEDIGTAEKKFKDPFDFMNYAKLTFSCNQLPKTPDETGAFHKRHLVLLFNVTIPLEEQDKTLKAKLIVPEELDGVFVWALEGLYRLLERGQFNEPTTIDERRTQYRSLSDPILAFAENCIIEDTEEWETKSDIYMAVLNYCKTNGFVAPSDSIFFRELIKHVYYTKGQKTIDKQRVTVLYGVKLVEAARGTKDTRGPIPKVIPLDIILGNGPLAGLAPLADDAIKILKESGGKMQQQALFQALIKLGYHATQSRESLYGDSRFVFMGMDVNLGVAEGEKGTNSETANGSLPGVQSEREKNLRNARASIQSYLSSHTWMTIRDIPEAIFSSLAREAGVKDMSLQLLRKELSKAHLDIS